MNVDGKHYHSIWQAEDGTVNVIDQRFLPHRFEVVTLIELAEFEFAIKEMQVRGAPLIGATAAWGVASAMSVDCSDLYLEDVAQRLLQTRPTAVNLRWALDKMLTELRPLKPELRPAKAQLLAQQICDEDVSCCSAIGEFGFSLLESLWYKRKNREADEASDVLNILTHCNAGWLATVDWGTALAPIYKAHNAGIPVHVWVDETRPRNQGAMLTAWELSQHGIAHTLIADNTGGHLMQEGLVDVCIVGTDRTAANGDVCNKIGTYLKALAAFDNQVPFYVALPSSTVDWDMPKGVGAVPIELRDGAEISHVWGQSETGETLSVRISPEQTPVANYAFDVTPARLVTGLITEAGVFDASPEGIQALAHTLSNG